MAKKQAPPPVSAIHACEVATKALESAGWVIAYGESLIAAINENRDTIPAQAIKASEHFQKALANLRFAMGLED